MLTLGTMTFQAAELPTRLPFGGSQMLAVHQLVGGQRDVDSLGPSEAPLRWSGIFLGANAEARARYLNQMRQDGKPLQLTWSKEHYSVVISTFSANYMQFYRVPYHIECTVISDLTRRLQTLPQSSTDQQIRADFGTAQSLSAQVGDSSLTGLMNTLNTAISNVSDFASATTSTLNSVLQPLTDVRARVGVLITSGGRTAQAVSTLGGILPNNTLSQGIANVTSQVLEQGQTPILYHLTDVLGRMNGNVGQISSSPSTRTVSVNGADLQQLAAKYYGDISQWTKIAAANGLRDTQVAGQHTLTIP